MTGHTLLPRNSHLRILPFVHNYVIFHVSGSFQCGEDTVNRITPDIVITLVILGKIRIIELDPILLIEVFHQIIDR
mgnify:CR=1 FL=1